MPSLAMLANCSATAASFDIRCGGAPTSVTSTFDAGTHKRGFHAEGGRRLGRWAKIGTNAWVHELQPVPPDPPWGKDPWANPVDGPWCDDPARPRISIILTAAVKAFINLARRGLKGQQRNTTERLEMYEQVVRRWAVASNVQVVFAENSGADLSTLEAAVPAWRRSRFEFLSMPYQPERLPARGRPDVGRIEARTIIGALNASKLLADRCPHDLIFGVTGRYFVHDFEHLVNQKCLRGRGKGPGQLPLPLVTPQNPSWRFIGEGVAERSHHERETSVMGFAASYAFEVLGWAVAPLPEMYEEYAHWSIGSEVHLGKLVRRMEEDPALKPRICDLPSLPIMPVKEGSSGKWRESV